MNLPEEIELQVLLMNSTPLEEFEGLSPAEMHRLLYFPYDVSSPVQLREDLDNDTLERIPLFRLAEDYLQILQRDKHIMLTKTEALPRKVIIELYEKKHIPDEMIENGVFKLWKETDYIPLRAARIALEQGGLVKKVHGKLTLTKKGTNLLPKEKRAQLFHAFFKAFTDKFAWSYHDLYPERTVGQFGWAFSVYLLAKFGGQPRAVHFYAGKYIAAFPSFLNHFDAQYSTPEDRCMSCYRIRTFDRFLVWFGLVKIEKGDSILEHGKDMIYCSDLIKKVFIVDEM